MQEREFTYLCQVAGWVTGFIGALFIFSGGLVGYIFTRHRDDNDSEHKMMINDYKALTEDVESLKIELTVLKTQRDAIMCERMKGVIK